MIFDQRERTQMQAGAQRDAVDAGIERGAQAHAQRLRGAFMVSFSMQLMKIMPSPRLASMVLPT